MAHSGLSVAAVLLVCLASLGLVGVVGAADGAAGDLDVANDSQLQDPGGVEIDDRLTGVEGTVAVFVRFTPAADATTPGALQAHAADAQADLQGVAARTAGLTVENSFWLANAALVHVDTDRLPVTALARIDGVERLVPNVEMEALPERPSPAADSTPGDERAGGSTGAPGRTTHGETTYGLDAIGAPTVWEEYGTQGEGTRVAVLDTGVDPDHPDIDLDGWAKFDANGTELDEPPQDVDPSGHGTHVSGTVAGGAASGTHIGVAPETELYHAVALRECAPACVVTVAQLVASMEWGVANDADVLSMSIGIPGAVEEFVEPVRNANTLGVAVVVSSGNEGEGLALSPANVYDAIGVGAADADGAIAGFSSGDEYDTDSFWGEAAPADWPETYTVPSVSGPGVSVLSSLPNGSYDTYSGTSMATPHVAGAIALAQSATERAVSPDAMRQALQVTAWKPDGWPTPGWAADTRYGFGHIDVPAVIEYLDAPSAVFRLDPRRPDPNGTVTFAATESFGDIGSYAWDVDGDGATDATGETVTHTFDEEGVYEVTLTVTAGAETDTTNRTVEVAPQPFEDLWTRDVGAPTRGGQTIVDGTVYVGGIDGHALNTTTGTGTNLPTRGPVWNAPTVVEGTAYFGTAGDENRVYAYDTGNKTLRWRTSTDGSVRASPTVVAGTVYAGSDDGGVYALDAATGEKRWRVETGGPVRGSPTAVETHPEPAEGAWTVLVGSDDGSVYALDGATGEQRWAVETGDRVRGAPTVSNGSVYVGSDDGSVRALALDTGQQEWLYQTEEPVRGAPTVSGGRVYVGGDDTTVYALDAATGDPVWTAETGGLVRGGPTVANGTVYVGSTGGNLYAFDAATGQRYWTSNLFAEIHTAPTVVNGTIYVSTDRNVHAIETRHTATSSDSRVALGTLGHEATWAEQAPTALFDIDPSVPRVGDPATFDATRSVGTIESYAWDFTGDGDPDTTGGTVTQSFESVDEYPVTLTVTDTAGRTATRAVPVAVSLPPVVGEHPPRDPTGDGRYEDVDGDGTVDIFDVQALFTGLDSDAVQSHAGAFDFDGDGTVGVLDVQALFERVRSGAF